jgi:transcription-repair coupling factor (superfamily II helicase)
MAPPFPEKYLNQRTIGIFLLAILGFIILLSVIGIRNLLKDLKGKKMGYDGKAMTVFLQERSPVDPRRIIELYRRKVRGVQLTPDLKLTIPMPDLKGSEILARAREMLRSLG